MDPGFGARLQAHREGQQITLSAISKETKIKLAMLEGLERDAVSQWPEGI
jgi:cytoskeletal protein RodZ